ncbi:MAG: SUF system Fe-S cluster assembly protein [Vicinamibacterales bacterium]
MDPRFLPMYPGSPSPDESPANALSQSLTDLEPDPARMAAVRPQVLEALSTIYDPEIPVNICELGLIYDVLVDKDTRVGVRMTLTAPACPAAQSLPVEVKEKVQALEGVSEARVEIVWDPPWTKERMSDAAKLQLGLW